MFAKCLAISNNSPMIANNFFPFWFCFRGLFLPGAFFFFLLLSIYFPLLLLRKTWTEYHHGFSSSLLECKIVSQ